MNRIIEQIDSVDWKSYSDAYNESAVLPEVFKRSISDDAEDSEDAWIELFERVWHQGTVYSVTSHAIPILLSIAENTEGEKRECALDLLDCISRGKDYYQVHAKMELFGGNEGEARYASQILEEEKTVSKVLKALESEKERLLAWSTQTEDLAKCAEDILSRLKDRKDEILI